MSPTERALRDSIDLLEAERAWLSDLLASPDFLPAIFPLSALEERLFKALLRRSQWTKGDLSRFIYPGARNDRDIPDEKNMDVLIHKVRKKLKPLGILIETSKAGGQVSLSDEARARFEAICEAECQREAAAVAAVLGDATSASA